MSRRYHFSNKETAKKCAKARWAKLKARKNRLATWNKENRFKKSIKETSLSTCAPCTPANRKRHVCVYDPDSPRPPLSSDALRTPPLQSPTPAKPTILPQDTPDYNACAPFTCEKWFEPSLKIPSPPLSPPVVHRSSNNIRHWYELSPVSSSFFDVEKKMKEATTHPYVSNNTISKSKRHSKRVNKIINASKINRV